jgi:hypothetical protein
MVEIKGVKTSHFMERETAPVACLDAGLIGHVERPQSEKPVSHTGESARALHYRLVGGGTAKSQGFTLESKN